MFFLKDVFNSVVLFASGLRFEVFQGKLLHFDDPHYIKPVVSLEHQNVREVFFVNLTNFGWGESFP